MKCQMCNGEGGKIPHPENYGSYREDCPACHGTGKQAPVDKIPMCPKCESLNQCQHCGHCTKCCSIEITTLEASLSVARGDAEKLCELEQIRTAELNDTLDRALSAEKRSREYAAECERYLAAIKEFCDRSKWAVDSWKKQDYIAALFEIANKESR